MIHILLLELVLTVSNHTTSINVLVSAVFLYLSDNSVIKGPRFVLLALSQIIVPKSVKTKWLVRFVIWQMFWISKDRRYKCQHLLTHQCRCAWNPYNDPQWIQISTFYHKFNLWDSSWIYTTQNKSSFEYILADSAKRHYYNKSSVNGCYWQLHWGPRL